MLQRQTEPVLFIYADDDHDDHEMLQEAISSSFLKLKVKSVYDGDQLIRLLSDDPDIRPAFAVVDINMPRMDGFTAIRYIRSTLKLDIPIYTLTTSRNPEDRKKARLLGVAGFYTKPARPSELKDIIEEMTLKSLRHQEK